MEEKGRIGIPRALMFYRFFPLWRPFFERLGWKVMVSDGVKQKEKIIYFEDSCLPMKLLVTHAAQLKDKVDHLFIPRLVSVHRTYIMCPKFRGAPDIVRLATEGKVSIIDETVDLRKGGIPLLRSFVKMGEKLGTSRQESRRAFREAEESFSKFHKDWVDRINRLPTRQLFEMDIPTPPPSKTPPWWEGMEGEVKKERLEVHCVSLSSAILTISSTSTSTKISSLWRKVWKWRS
jgi:predicted nucleotide-binding protein (sugar kinase/HSP70/actin superfamily)